MAINIKSLKFNADEKLLAYVNKKVEKLEKFFDNMGDIDVTLSLLPDTPENKAVQVKTHLPGEDLIIERNAKTFEDAITECADAMKEKLTRFKEKLYEA